MPIGTTAALILGGLALGGQTAANIYGTRSAGKQNKRAQDLTAQSDTRAADLERARLAEERRALDVQLQFQRDESARKKAQYDAALAQDNSRWQDYIRINEPYWKQGAGVLGSLYDIAGMPGQAPGYAAPSRPAPLATGGGGMSLADLSTSVSSPVAGPISYGTRSAAMTPPSRTPATFPTMAIPKGGGMSLEQLMQLAQASGGSMPRPSAAAPYYVGTDA